MGLNARVELRKGDGADKSRKLSKRMCHRDISIG